MRSLKEIGWALTLCGMAAATGLAVRQGPAAAQNATNRAQTRGGDAAPAGVELRRYGPLLVRPVTIAAVVKSTGRDDFGLIVYYDAPRDEVHAAVLDDAAGAKQLWADLADMAARDPRAGLKPLGELAIVRADAVAAAWGQGPPGVPNDVGSIHLDLGAPEPVSIEADDQAFSRDQVRAAWQSLASLAPAPPPSE